MIRENDPELQPAFPFGYTRRDYALVLQHIPARDLIAEIEASQWLALDLADVPGDSRAIAEIQISEMVEELERRQRLLKARHDDPLAPRWPGPDRTLKTRVETVKTAWPIVRYCVDLLGCDLQPAGSGKWKCRCPLPGHEDMTPSFIVYEASDSSWCFGCQRGGDVIGLTKFAHGYERFTDALDHLEATVGVQ